MYHLAGGGAYYFAKQSINAERDARYEAELNRKYQLKAMETEYRRQTKLNAIAPNSNGGTKPRRERDTISEYGNVALSKNPIQSDAYQERTSSL